MKPLLLLDIDGVLNPFEAKPTRRPEGYSTFRLRPSGFLHARKPLRVWLNYDHGALLLRLAEALDAELVWATMWEEDANAMIGPRIGLPWLPVIHFDEKHILRSWKYPDVLAYAQDRPLVWLDDSFHERDFQREQEVFLEKRGNLPTLLYHVSARTGLIESDIESVVRAFKILSV